MRTEKNLDEEGWRSPNRIIYGMAGSDLGQILVAATECGVCAVLLGDDRGELVDEMRARFPVSKIVRADAEPGVWLRDVVALVENPRREWRVPLDLCGTRFQCEVWRALRGLRPGQTVTYTDLAVAIGKPGAVRAVASACAANPVAVGVPCHRVIRRDGGLSGYRWGVARKRELLLREEAEVVVQTALFGRAPR